MVLFSRFSIGLTIHLVKNKPCLEWAICGVEKVKLTYPHTRLGLNPQIVRPLSRIVVPLVYLVMFILRVISTRSMGFWHVCVWLWHSQLLLRHARMWLQDARVWFKHAQDWFRDYDFHTQSVASTHTRDTYACEYGTQECDFYTVEWDFYTHSVISKRIVILTRTNVKTTFTTVISTRTRVISTRKVWFRH
jgi:hypothetical protein